MSTGALAITLILADENRKANSLPRSDERCKVWSAGMKLFVRLTEGRRQART